MKDAGRRIFLISVVLGFGARAVEAGAKFVMQFQFAKALNAAGSGVVFLALGVVTVLAVLARIGLDRSLTLLIAHADARGEKAEIRALIGTGLGMTIVVAGILSGLTWATATPVAELVFHEPILADALRTVALSILPFALLAVAVGILNGLNQPGVAQIVGGALWPGLTAALAFVVATSAGAVTVIAASVTVAAACSLAVLARAGALVPPGFDRRAARALLNKGWPVLVVDTVQTALISMPTMILGMNHDVREVGVFALCSRISLVLTIVLIVLSGIGSSQVAAAHALGRQEALQAVLRRLVATALLVSTPAFLLLFLFPGPILSLFGPDFTGGATMLRVLLVGQVFGILFTCAPSALEMTGNGWRLQRLNLVAFVVCLAACMALIPRYGGMGAAVATTLTVGCYNLGSMLAVRYYLGVHASPWALRAPRMPAPVPPVP